MTLVVSLYVLLEQYFKHGADFYSSFLHPPQAQVFCSQVSAISAGDIFAIKPHGFADGEKLLAIPFPESSQGSKTLPPEMALVPWQ
jgi:hypothetical protein